MFDIKSAALPQFYHLNYTGDRLVSKMGFVRLTVGFNMQAHFIKLPDDLSWAV